MVLRRSDQRPLAPTGERAQVPITQTVHPFVKESRTATVKSSPGAAAINETLSEVIDVVADVKQADRKVSRNHELHGQLDMLFEDLRTWASLLMAEGDQLGSPPLGNIPTMSGRTLRNLWPGSPTDEEICRSVLGRIDRLSIHLATARGEQEDEDARALLVNIQQGLRRHVHALSGC
jgi:hypothetical protein